MISSKFAALILSAGSSARMKSFKPLLPLGGKPLLVHVIETVQAAGAGEVRVVVGHRAEELALLVEKTGAGIVRNPDPTRGMFSSVCAGVGRLSPSVEAFFLLPVDLPLVRPSTLKRLIAAWRGDPGRIVHPVFAGRRGHPPLISSDLISSILGSAGDGGLRAVLEGHEERAVEVPVADRNILFDLDRPEDYEAAKRRYADLETPSAAECDAILSDVHPVETAVIRHGRRVQRAAAAICRALNRSGAGLDESRIAAAALLHDIAKGAPDHAEQGRRILTDLGFGGVGEIVAAHTDLPGEEVRNPREAAVVYLADKLVSQDRFVSLESRFEAAVERFEEDRPAQAAAKRRRAAAMDVKQKVEETAGLPLGEILLDAGIRLDREADGAVVSNFEKQR